ncbi:ATPase, T2SS/T4P/T4SS family [Candidatus Poribacteria bacterium]
MTEEDMGQDAQEKELDTDVTNELDPRSDEIVDMKEAIKLLNTTRSTFYRWVREGKVKGMKVGRQWRFYREDIERFLKGEEPRIELSADIGPLIENLRQRLGIEAVDHTTDSVITAVDLMIALASNMNASDIHLAPHTKEGNAGTTAVLRYRVDGTLQTVAEVDPRLMTAIINRWKAMAHCDIGEKQKPQDGRLVAKVDDKKMELRVTFLPSGLGESLTVRIMAGAAWLAHLKLDDLGFSPRDRERILRWLHAPWGIIIVSGPTGSGKTTALYACLSHIARPEIKLLTVENPVEVFLPWAVQTPVNPDAGLTFAAALRSVLRSDPDVIMVGDVRDPETLDMIHECALTGHLILTQMHASGAAGALKRMVDLGSEPYIISESTKLIIAQRLVRKLCPDCSVEHDPPTELLDRIAKVACVGGLSWDSLPKKFCKPVGCPNCRETGYKGRNLIAETLEITPEIITVLARDASLEELQAIAIDQGMTTIAADGVRRATMGETSIAEIMRVAVG